MVPTSLLGYFANEVYFMKKIFFGMIIFFITFTALVSPGSVPLAPTSLGALNPGFILPVQIVLAADSPDINKPSSSVGSSGIAGSNMFSPLSTTGQETQSEPTSTSTCLQTEMLDYINTARSSADVSPLVLDDTLSYGADLKVIDMISNNYFSHISPTYGSPIDMMNSLGITHTCMGENLAKNFSVKAAFDAFMNSPGHRANLLNPDFGKIGLAFYQSGSYLYVSQWFTD